MKRKVSLQGLALLLVLGTTTNVFADNNIKISIPNSNKLDISYLLNKNLTNLQEPLDNQARYGGDIVYYYNLGSGSSSSSTRVNQDDYYTISELGVRVNTYNVGQVGDSILYVPEPDFTNAFKKSGYNYGHKFYIGEDFNHSHTHNLYIVVQEPIKKEITINSATVENKIYDGNTTANVSSISFNGLDITDELIKDVDYTVKASFDNANVGENKDVSMTVTLLDTDDASKYTLKNNTFNTKGAIDKKEITINSATVQNKVYNGDTVANINNIVFNGLVNSDELVKNTDYTVQASFDNANVGDDKNVTLNVTLLNNNKTNSYKLINSPFKTKGSILKGNSTIDNIKILNEDKKETNTFDFSNNLIVQGTPKQRTALNKMELLLDNQVISTQNATLNNQVNFNVDLNSLNIEAGTYELKLKYGGNSNLNASEESLGNITINKVNLIAEINENVFYNGSNTFQVQLKNIKTKNNKKILSDVKANVKVTLNNKNIGSYTDFSINEINFEDDLYNHFKIEDTSNDIKGTINITKKPIAIKSATIEDKKYDGNTNSNVLDVKFNDLIDSEILEKGVDFNVTGKFDNANVGDDKNVEVLVDLLDTEKANNYQITSPFNATGNITKSNSTIDVDGAIEMKNEFVYGESIDISVSPKIEKTRNLDIDKIQLIYNDEVLSSGSYNIESGKYELSYSTEDKKLPISNNIPVKIKFTGNNNLNSSEYDTTISLKPKEITATYSLNYDYDNSSTKETLLKLNGVLAKDKIDVLATLYLDETTLNVNDNVVVKDIDYTLNDNYYILPKENITGNITINKANIENQKGNISILNKLEKNYVFNIKDILPTLEENKSFGNLTFEDLQYNEILDTYLKNAPILQEDKILMNVNNITSEEENLIGTITLNVKSINYNDFKLEVSLNAINKIKPNLTINQKENLTYGDKLEKLQLDFKATYEDKDVKGTLKINENLEDVYNAGVNTINVTFIPDDYETYDEITKDIKIRINKALAKAIIQPIVVNKENDKLLASYEFIDNGKFQGINNEVLEQENYTLKWNDLSEQVKENKPYKYSMINNNYYIKEELIPLKVYEDEENINSGNGADISDNDNNNNNNNNNNETSNIEFDDLDDNHFAKDEIQDLVRKGIVKGYNRLIRPDEPITRAEFAVLLNNTCKYLGVDTNNLADDSYTDVYKDKYYYNDIYKATYLDTMIGYNDGTFKPDNNITREESIVSIYKLISLCNLDIELSYPINFKDYEQVSVWAKPYFDELNSKGILKGDNNGNFKPKDSITRVEAMVLIYSILNK